MGKPNVRLPGRPKRARNKNKDPAGLSSAMRSAYKYILDNPGFVHLKDIRKTLPEELQDKLTTLRTMRRSPRGGVTHYPGKSRIPLQPARGLELEGSYPLPSALKVEPHIISQSPEDGPNGISELCKIDGRVDPVQDEHQPKAEVDMKIVLPVGDNPEVSITDLQVVGEEMPTSSPSAALSHVAVDEPETGSQSPQESAEVLVMNSASSASGLSSPIEPTVTTTSPGVLEGDGGSEQGQRSNKEVSPKKVTTSPTSTLSPKSEHILKSVSNDNDNPPVLSSPSSVEDEDEVPNPEYWSTTFVPYRGTRNLKKIRDIWVDAIDKGPPTQSFVNEMKSFLSSMTENMCGRGSHHFTLSYLFCVMWQVMRRVHKKTPKSMWVIAFSEIIEVAQRHMNVEMGGRFKLPTTWMYADNVRHY